MSPGNKIERIALVTGGTRGIGRAIAEELARSGHKVIITARGSGDNVAAEISKKFGECHYLRLDVSKEDEVDNCFNTVADKFGGCDILINNAGISKDFLLMRSKLTDWRQIIDVNLIGTLLCSRAAIKQMIKKGWGRIINISSVVGIMGNPGQTVYVATKAALIGLTKSLAKEVGSRKITVNAIAPGFIESDMTAALSETVRTDYAKTIPLGYFGKPTDVAPSVAFLASDAASYITGQVVSINGGMI